jgi:hypothetical protein
MFLYNRDFLIELILKYKRFFVLMIVLMMYTYSVQYFGYGEKCDKIFNELAWLSLNLQAFYQSWPSSAVPLSFLLGNPLPVLV